MEPLSALAIFGPLLIELGKAGISKIFGSDNFKPANVNDWVLMRKTEVDLFNAVNSAGGTNPSYPWVEAVIRLQRPIIAAVVTVVWGLSHVFEFSPEQIKMIDSVAAPVWFYLFGDRTLMYVRNTINAKTNGAPQNGHN